MIECSALLSSRLCASRQTYRAVLSMVADFCLRVAGILARRYAPFCYAGVWRRGANQVRGKDGVHPEMFKYKHR
jgi:hypothetical protein